MTPLKYCSVILLRRRECIWIGVGVGIKKMMSGQNKWISGNIPYIYNVIT